MPKVYLTAAERETAQELQKQQALMQGIADGLATYCNRQRLTRDELGN